MNGSSSYWLVGDQPATPTSPPPLTPTSPVSPATNDRNLHVSAPTARRPQTFVAIHPNSNISWAPAPLQNGSSTPLIVFGGKEKSQFRTVGGAQHVSAIQHVPPTHQRRHYTGNDYIETSNGSSLVSSTSNSEIDVPSEPVNFREDIELDDQNLVTISTKELNRRLKKKGISKARQKEIKSERRTLKNRGKCKNISEHNQYKKQL